MSYDGDYIDALACKLAEERSGAEVELIGSVLADPSKGVGLAEREGITAKSFGQPDLAVIFAAARRARSQPKVDILFDASCRLMELGFWDTAMPRLDRGMRWSDRSIVSLACSFPCSATTPAYARRLQNLIQRQQGARNAYLLMVANLEGTIETKDFSALTRPSRLIAGPVNGVRGIYAQRN
jgi:hypothetical protein